LREPRLLAEDGPVVSVTADIEDALVAHWSQFGLWRRGELHDENGLLWFETPIAHLPYNGVIRTQLGADADVTIAAALERFRAREVECFWFAHPSATPVDLGERLAAHGLRAAEQITCMSLDLAAWVPAALPPGFVFREVLDEDDARTYTELTSQYWQIPDHDQPLVAELHGHWDRPRSPGRRYLALADGRAIAKGYLSLAGPPGVAAIFGMSVRPEARGQRVATGLTTALLQRARAEGCRTVVLHSTPVAVGVYRRAGFVKRSALTIFATAPLWSRSH
jgi:ribosomal protein S18 acetylase RimI-like enzyme